MSIGEHNSPLAAQCEDVRSSTVGDVLEQLYHEIGALGNVKDVLFEKVQRVLAPPSPSEALGKSINAGNSALSSAICEAAMQIRSLRKEIEDINSRIDL